MKAATLFSGIGAPEMAMPHWKWIWHAEIEKFPAAVMAERFPESVNLGDVTAHDFVDRALAIGRPDVLVFGSPCQSFSVAGKRLGLDDPRGNLALIALGIVARIGPQWIVFENVPGLLSSAQGDDFRTFLRAVPDCGHLGVWRVLDAQYFGLAQRRKRLFFVGRAGDWRGPAAVLLEPESLCGDSPSRSQARESAPSAVDVGAEGGSSVANTLQTKTGRLQVEETLVPVQAFGGGNQSGSIKVATTTTKSQRLDFDSETFVIQAGALRENPNSGPDGVGVQAGIAYTLEARAEVQAVASTLKSNNGGGGFGSDPSETFVPVMFQGRGSNLDTGQDVTGTLSQNCDRASGGAPCVAYAFNHQSGGDMRGIDLRETAQLQAHQHPAVTVALRGREGGATAELGGEVATALRASGGGGDKSHVLTQAVRRLMPVECERLQGFPDHHTAITYRGKPAADGPRYKAIGNSMAVPVVRWILTRIEFVDKLLKAERVA